MSAVVCEDVVKQYQDVRAVDGGRRNERGRL